MNFLRRVLVCSAMAAGMSGVAMADGIVTYTGTFGPQSTDFTFTGANAISLQQFMAGIGGVPGDATLSGVALQLSVSETTTVLSLTNNANVSETFGVNLIDDVFPLTDSASAETNFVSNADAPVTIFTTGLSHGIPIQSITLGPAGSGACPPNTPSNSCNSVTYNNVTVSASSGLYNIGSSFWSGYEGAGTFTIGGQTNAGTTFNGGGNNITAGVTTNATITAEVVYSYSEPSATPEPTTMVLFGSALVVAGLIRKRIRN